MSKSCKAGCTEKGVSVCFQESVVMNIAAIGAKLFLPSGNRNIEHWQILAR